VGGDTAITLSSPTVPHQYVQSGSAYGGTFNGTATATLECWITPTSQALSDGGSGNPPTLVGFVQGAGVNILGLRIGGANDANLAIETTGGLVNIGTGTNTLTAGTTYHVVGTYDGTTAKLYLNASLLSSTNISGTMAVNAEEFMVGPETGGSGRYYDGVIDEAAIYTTALTSTRITAHYDAGLGNVQAVTATHTQTPTLTQNKGKEFDVTHTQTPTLTRGALSLARTLSVTQTQTVTETAGFGKTISPTQTQTPSMTRLVGLHTSAVGNESCKATSVRTC
jgi:hypothetical protein